MKKSMRILVLVLAAMMALCCSAQAITQSEIQGVWDVDLPTMFVDQGFVNSKEEADALIALLGGMTMTVEFTADQQFVTRTVTGGEIQRQAVTYTLLGDTVVLEDGSRSTLTLSGNALTILDPDGTTLVLTRRGAANTVVIEGNDDLVYGNSIVGVWDMDVLALMKMSGATDEDLAGMEAYLSLMTATMEFTADGRCIMVATAFGQEVAREETAYKVSGNTIEMDGSPAQYTLSGDTLTITEDGLTMTLTRSGTADNVQPTVAPAAPAGSVVGVWNMDVPAVMKMSGMSEEELAEIEPFLALMTATVEFTADGRCIMVVSAFGEEASREETTYSISGNTMYMNDGSSQFVLEGNTLTLIGEGDGLSMVLTK